MRIIADNTIPFLQGVLEPFAEIFYMNPSHITKEIVKNADALLVRTRTKCNAEMLEQSAVKFIGTPTIGFDHIDLAYCEEKGIKWVNAPGCNSSSVQQYIASALLTLTRLNNFQLDSKTIGIIGVGNVGSKVENIAKIFRMKILLNDPPRERNESSKKFVALDKLLNESDIITFHVPLIFEGTDRTFHLADKEFFKKFDQGKIIINTSRGEVVDTNELKSAIKNKKVISSVLDVWENEPDIDNALMNLVDIATPHIAGYSIEGKANGTAACINALNEYLNLGIEKNWYPKQIPSPTRSKQIKIDCTGKSKQEIFFECINSTYEIIKDDHRLRTSVTNFEKQRIEYPVRREFNYYDVHLFNADKSLQKTINEFGFNLIKK